MIELIPAPMLRAYVIILVLVAMGAALLERLPTQYSAAARGPINVSHSTGQSSSAPAATSQSIDELGQGIELTRDSNGYFYADVQINGAPIHMVVDTGATAIALSRNDAQLAGIATPIAMDDVVGEGADGVVKGQQVILDRVTLGGKTVERLPAIVLNSGGQSLLGQAFLSQFASVKIEGDKMVLR